MTARQLKESSASAIFVALLFLQAHVGRAAQKPSPKVAAPTALAQKAAASSPAQKAASSKSVPASTVKAEQPDSAGKLAVPITLSDGERTISRTRQELGFALKSKAGEPVAFSVDAAQLKAALTRIAPQFHQDAIAPHPILAKGVVSIDQGTQARSLNVAATAQAIANQAANDAAKTKFTVALDKHPSAMSADRYKGIDGVLAQFATRTNSNPKRNHNVALAAATIDGTLLAPGAVFSVNETVGKRTQARGFLTAPVFVNAEMVPGIGGGVSQITGTLFNAAARAGLKIIEVYPHSRPVAYLPIGYDATVAFGEEDLKFKNNTQGPVFIDYHFDIKSRRLTATLFGKKTPGQTIRLQANIQRLAPGRVDAQLIRITKQNGKVVSKERLFKHHYRWDPSTKA